MAVRLVSTVILHLKGIRDLFICFLVFLFLFFFYFQEKVCLRYVVGEEEEFLHEAEMANLLCHQNVLAIHGVVIASSYSPMLALVSYLLRYLLKELSHRLKDNAS